MLTWHQLVTVEPMLATLEKAALYVAEHADGDEEWCANRAWHDELKSPVSRVVGWGRELKLVEARVTTDESVDLAGSAAALLDELKTPPAPAADDFLRGEEAYEVAVKHLYEFLPDCRHDGDCLYSGG